jgi:hypothetical protein
VARAFAVRATGLAYNLAKSLQQLVLPRSIRSWNLPTLREKLPTLREKLASPRLET